DEHNYFTTKPWMLNWFQNQFERKWNNLGPAPETSDFRPLPPGPVQNVAPAAGATTATTEVAVKFDAGPFAHLYDVYIGTTPDPPLVAANVELGPTETPDTPRSLTFTGLAPATTYYWKVVAKTMALQQKTGPVWSFTSGAQRGPMTGPTPITPTATTP